MKVLSILFHQKRNLKIGLCDDLALTTSYTIKKIIPSILSRYGENLARVNGMLEKIEFEKNDKQNL